MKINIKNEAKKMRESIRKKSDMTGIGFIDQGGAASESQKYKKLLDY